MDQKFLDEIVHLLGLEDKLKNMPNNLSGGQQQLSLIHIFLVIMEKQTGLIFRRKEKVRKRSLNL